MSTYIACWVSYDRAEVSQDGSLLSFQISGIDDDGASYAGCEILTRQEPKIG